MAFEKQCDDAAVKGDVAFLERALSSDFVMTHGDGWTSGGAPLKVDTKATWLAYVGKQPLPYVYRNLDSIQVELHGDVAITVGRYRYLPRTDLAESRQQPLVRVVRARLRQAGRSVAVSVAPHGEGTGSGGGRGEEQ